MKKGRKSLKGKNMVLETKETKKFLTLGNLNFYIALIALVVSIISLWFTIIIDQNTVRNLNMNYTLKSVSDKPVLLKREKENVVFNVKPYQYDLEYKDKSGKYLNIYFSRFDKNNECLLKK